MDNITIQVHANRKLSKKTVDIGNMLENKVTKLIFELDEDIVALGGNVYLFVTYDGESHPYPLTDNTLIIGRELTQRKKSEANIVVSTSEDTDNILDGAVWVSNTLVLLTDKNNINIDAINEQELPPSLQIVYDNLLNLQKELEEMKVEVPTKTSELENDSGFLTELIVEHDGKGHVTIKNAKVIDTSDSGDFDGGDVDWGF